MIRLFKWLGIIKKIKILVLVLVHIDHVYCTVPLLFFRYGGGPHHVSESRSSKQNSSVTTDRFPIQWVLNLATFRVQFHYGKALGVQMTAATCCPFAAQQGAARWRSWNERLGRLRPGRVENLHRWRCQACQGGGQIARQNIKTRNINHDSIWFYRTHQ